MGRPNVCKIVYAQQQAIEGFFVEWEEFQEQYEEKHNPQSMDDAIQLFAIFKSK